jgi:endonuclease-3
MKKIDEILRKLEKLYPSTRTALRHTNPFQLLIATILSAQSTDILVNRVTPALFKKFPSPDRLANATIEEIESLISSVNFFHNKARYLQQSSQQIVSRHKGVVPNTMEELTALSGVARKTANVVLSQAFNINIGVVVDTHVARISRRLGLTKEVKPTSIEQDLMKIIPQDQWKAFSSRIILHGRSVCKAINPLCGKCALKRMCPYAHLQKKEQDSS